LIPSAAPVYRASAAGAIAFVFSHHLGAGVARLCQAKDGSPVRIMVDVLDLPLGRTTSHAVASYVHAVLKLHALRRELADVAVEVAKGKKMIASRYRGAGLLAEAQTMLKELGVDPDVQ